MSLTTGSFAVQSTWANDDGSSGGCETSHPIFSAGTVTVTNPGNQTGATGTAVSLQIQAGDTAPGQTLTYSATGLPTGLAIGASTGLVSGTPSAGGTFSSTVTATDTTGAKGSASFSWTVTSPDTVTVTNPGNQCTMVNHSVSLQIHATDSAGLALTYTATSLPTGLRINASTGLVSGTPTVVATYSVTVTATDSSGVHGSTSFSWTVRRKAHAGTALRAV
ncbi:MAG: putative Ig domain-containing protein [Acidobacteriota bacterium]|nr:putative Ig domain-containing protein [Acidobacteriota bacterium]